MRVRKILCLLLACMMSVSCLSMNVAAAGGDAAVEAVELDGRVSVYATGRFSMDVPGKTIIAANSSFPLEAGETVTIKASYSPFTASVDFGLVDADGYFYYFNENDGSVDKTIEVSKRGNYTLAVRNNSSQEINVSGYVNY